MFTYLYKLFTIYNNTINTIFTIQFINGYSDHSSYGYISIPIGRKRFWSLYVNFEIENIIVKVIIIHCLLMSCVI